jgi:hypothetical protein
MSGHEFMLPDELGWTCSDEVHKCIANWLTKVGKEREKRDWTVGNEFRMFMEVAIAELSDDVYSIIKNHQTKELKKA